MHEYYFSIAGLNIRMDTPFELKIRSESIPFLAERSSEYDIRIIFHTADQLPECPQNGHWADDIFYTFLDAAPACFIRNYPGADPYAVLIQRGIEFECIYLPQFEKYVSVSSSVLNVIGLEKILIDNQGFLLHASFIRWQGRGILFSAPSETGKSTQADLWERYRCSETLNGDRAGIRQLESGWRAYGMPFAGTSGIYRQESAPIAAIVTLAQGPENVIRKLRPMDAVCRLLPECSCRRWDPGFMNVILDLLLQLVQQVPVYLLECRPDEGAVDLLFDTMKKDGLL